MNLAIRVLREGAVASEDWPRKQERGVATVNLAIHVLKEGAVASEGWPRKQERGVVIIEEDEVPARMGNQENVLRKKGGGVAVRTLT